MNENYINYRAHKLFLDLETLTPEARNELALNIRASNESLVRKVCALLRSLRGFGMNAENGATENILNCFKNDRIYNFKLVKKAFVDIASNLDFYFEFFKKNKSIYETKFAFYKRDDEYVTKVLAPLGFECFEKLCVNLPVPGVLNEYREIFETDKWDDVEIEVAEIEIKSILNRFCLKISEYRQFQFSNLMVKDARFAIDSYPNFIEHARVRRFMVKFDQNFSDKDKPSAAIEKKIEDHIKFLKSHGYTVEKNHQTKV